jgi:hypothetical protein
MDSDFTDLSAEYWSPHLRMAVAEMGHEFRCSVSRKLRKIRRHKLNRSNTNASDAGIIFFEEKIRTGTAELSTGSATAVATPLKGISCSPTDACGDSINSKARLGHSIESSAKKPAELFPHKTSYFQWLSQLMKKHPIDTTDVLHDDTTTATSILTTCPVIDKNIFDVSPSLFKMVRLDPLGLQLTTGLTETEFEQSPLAASSTEPATAVMSEQEFPAAKMQIKAFTEAALADKSSSINEECNGKCQNGRCLD